MLNLDRTPEYAIIGVMALAMIFVIGAIFASASFESKHPCVKYGQRETCIQPGYFVNSGNTMIWIPEQQYDCTPCIERK